MAETKIIKPQAGFQERFVRSNIDFVVGGGVLNPQPWDSKVATPYGFVNICDLKAGDEICDTKGGVQRVNYIIDKGVQDSVEFTLRDGRKVRSALSHHWKVKERHGYVLDVAASDIIDYINKERERSKSRKHKHVNLYRIPMSAPCHFVDKYREARTIHPYVLGFLLGDGCISKKAHSIYISVPKQDLEVVDYFNKLGYNTVIDDKTDPECMHYAIRGCGIRKKLETLGLLGCLSADKFIPDAYKYAPIEERKELLRGLFDSDGSCEERTGQASYHSTSIRLIKDIQEVIWSLGGIANYSTFEETVGSIKGKQYIFKESYMLRVRIEDDTELFRFERKRSRAKHNSERRQQLYLGIVDYKILEPTQMYCINVSDDEHLYLTDNYVVTRNCGKTFAAVLSVAEASLDPNFRAVFLRNNLNDLKSGGGILDTFRDVYGTSINIVESGDPSVTFDSGAKCDVTHVADQSRDKVMQRFKGRQYDYIYFDEGTGFTWETFTTIYSRNRGKAKWTGKVRMTTNPDRNHWLRTFLDWYIGIDGFIREDREGVVRYFYMAGESVKDVVWGDTKEECYHKCKIDIDRKLAKINGKTGTATYKDMIKSFTFYLGRMSENKASLGNNSGYVGSVAVSGGRNAEQLLEGNWNVSPDDDTNSAITSEEANQILVNDPQINGDRWVTCDLADVGTDNFVSLAWNGFHLIDTLVLAHTTPRQNAERLEMFAASHGVANNHIIYDATRALYINDYIPEAIPFISSRKPMGMYGRMAMRLKDECYLRLVDMIKRRGISIGENVANKIYEHQKNKSSITFANEFIEECLVVAFKEVQSGKKTLLTKREMNQKLGKGRSMDVLDPFAMRMLPVLEFAYGEELWGSIPSLPVNEDDSNGYFDLFNDNNWC